MSVEPSQTVTEPLAQHWEKGYSVGMHLTTLAMHAFIPVVPALVMWLIKRHDSPYVDDHGREVVNFQITLLIYAACAAGLTVASVGVLAFVVWPVLYIFCLLSMILGAVAGGNGRYFRYPACIRLVK